MWQKLDCSLKDRVIAIGALHGVGLVCGILNEIWNITAEARPVTDGDIFYMSLHFVVHTFLISSLIMGAKMGNPILVLPWLIVTFPVFVFVSYCTLKYSRFTYLAQLIFNIFFICLGWCLWLTVFQFLRHSRDVNRKPQKT